MKKIYFALMAILTLAVLPSHAKLVDTSPALLQESSHDIVLTYHADSPLGNGGLKDLPESTDVYAHIGVITSASTTTGDWRYTVTPWPESDGSNSQQANTPKNRLTYAGPNTYTLNIGSIRSYFGITDPNETVRYIAMVFRTADGRKEGKTSTGGDILVEVLPEGFQMTLESDAPSLIINEAQSMNFTVNTTAAANLTLTANDERFASANAAMTLNGTYTINKAGNNTITATAVYDGKTYTKSLNVVYTSSSQPEDYPGGIPKMGAVRNNDGSVTFCLAAPGKKSVMLVPSWNDYAPSADNMMKYQDYEGNRYFWTTVPGLDNDKWYPYYYIVDDTYKVADPYAHLILDCYSDNYIPSDVWPDMPKYPYDKLSGVMLAVYRGDIDDYDFDSFTIPDHESLVVYEMLFRDFTGSEGVAEGNGTVRKAIEKIPYIKSLGFNAVELMPIMEFNGNNSWGYNTNFYMAPDKAYGSPTDYKDFINECHRQGIAVILDIVFNQSDGLHPWYQLYPIESNPFYNRVAPHEFSVLNDWNQGNALVQQQWTDAVRYWMEAYNVDGYRFDLVKGLGDNESYAAAGGTNQYNQSRIDRMIRLHNVIKSVKPDGIHINEDLAGAEEEIALGNDGQIQWANINSASGQFTMGWDDGDNNLVRFLSANDGGRPWGSTISYAESHDEERLGYKDAAYGIEAVKGQSLDNYKRLGTLAAQMLLTPGPKMVWQFGEFGNEQTTKTTNGVNNTDPKIVDWEVWLADPDRHYLMETYAALIGLRMENPEMFKQDARYMAFNFNSKFTNRRYMRLGVGNKEIAVFINPAISGETIDVVVSCNNMTQDNSKLVWASPGFTPTLTSDGKRCTVAVPPHSFAVFSTKDVVFSGISDEVIDRTEPVAIGGDGEIIIRGDYENAEVFDLAGRRLPSLTVPAGAYIVRIDGNTSKVIVR